MTEQPRRSNGQFGEVSRDEATVSLAPVPAVPPGSFLYPPILRNADDAIAFWEQEEIPDEVLNKCRAMYVAQFQATVDYGPEEMWEGPIGARYDEEHPMPSDPTAQEAWREERERYGAQYVNGLRETLRGRPEFLDPRDVRQLAKVVGYIGTAMTLPREEGDRLREHGVELTTGRFTVREINTNYGLFAIGEYLRDPDRYDEAKRDERLTMAVAAVVNVALAHQSGQIREEFGNVNDNVRQTAQIVIDTA